MINRKQKIQELLIDLQSLRRTMALRSAKSAEMPRITPSQWGVLMLLEQKGSSNIKDVATSFSVTSSAATQLVDGLVTSGYVLRKTHAKDRRSVTLTLSKKSATQLAKIKKHAAERFLTLLESLNDAEFTQYVALNKKIAQGFLAKKK